MDIKKPDIKWEGKLQPFKNLLQIDSIGLHHMAHPTWTFEEVHRFHTYTNNWIGIGYNWWIAFDGTIYMGRGFNKGAGVGGHNSHILSIGFQGDYENVNKEMPKAQYEAGVWLIRYLRNLVPSIKTVAGHKKWNATACPGKYFPLQKMIEDGMKEETEEEIMLQKFIEKYTPEVVEKGLDILFSSVSDDGLPSEWAEKEFKEAKDLEITDGTNPEMLATRQEVAIMVKRAVSKKIQ